MGDSLFALKSIELPETTWSRSQDELFRDFWACFETSKPTIVASRPRGARQLGYQLSLRFVEPFTRFVTKPKRHLLDFELTPFFQKPHRCGVSFTRVGFKLEKVGVCFVGDLVQMTENEFREFTKDERLIQKTKLALTTVSLGFGMAAPKWERPDDSAIMRWHNF